MVWYVVFELNERILSNNYVNSFFRRPVPSIKAKNVLIVRQRKQPCGDKSLSRKSQFVMLVDYIITYTM